MKVESAEYNVGYVTIPTALTSGTKVKIGTLADYDQVKALSTKAGVIIAEVNLGGNNMCGTCLVNPSVDGEGLEFSAITNYGGNPVFISFHFTKETDGAYLKPTVVSLGNAAKSAKKAE